MIRVARGDPDSYSEAWKKCRGRGDKAVRVLISWDEQVKA